MFFLNVPYIHHLRFKFVIVSGKLHVTESPSLLKLEMMNKVMQHV